MEAKIEIADIVNKAIKSAIMEEVNNLGIRAVVREKIESVGELNKEDARELGYVTVDSYVRSLNDLKKQFYQTHNLKVIDTMRG